MRWNVTVMVLVSALASPAFAQSSELYVPKKAPAPPPPKQPQLTKPPELLDYASPEYPQELFAQGIEGEAVVFIDIDATGHVTNVEVERVSNPAFAAPAIAAARKFVFSPAEIDGAPDAIRIEYRFVFESVVPEPDAIAGAPEEVRTEQGPVNFRGLVRAAVTRKPIEGATVFVDDRPTAVTNDEGIFEVRGAPAGTFKVRIVAPGRRIYVIDEERGADQLIEGKYYLLPLDNNPYETVITTRPPKREVSKVYLQRAELTNVAGTFGDPIRVIENLPGMGRAFGGIGGQLLVRGANPEDTKVFVDGVEVPFLYHFSGLTSVIQAQFLDHIEFSPGGFGAKYGRSTAGIVDVGTRIMDCDGFHGNAKVDFVDSAYFSCVPLGDSGWKLGTAVRRSYIDLILPLVLNAVNNDPDQGTTSISPVYFDYQMKATKQLGKNTFEVFLFGSADDVSIAQTGSLEDVNYDFGSKTYFNRTMLRHRYKFSDNATLTSQVTPGFTKIGFNASSDEIDVDNQLSVSYPSIEWREQFDYRLAKELALSLGIDHQFGSAKVSLDSSLNNTVRTFPSPVTDYSDSTKLTERLSAYSQGYWVEAQIDAGRFKITPGFRFERIDFAHTQGYEYLPRLNVRWQAFEKTAFKAAWGIYEKLPEAQYFVSAIGNPYLGPEKSVQWIAGAEHAFTDIINLDVQGFYTRRTHLRQESTDVVSTSSGVRSEVYNNGGTGHTIGLQALLRYELQPNGHFFGWVSYTLSRTVVTNTNTSSSDTDSTANDGILQGKSDRYTYLSDSDQTHILTVIAQWVLSKGWEAGFRFRLTSGNPYTSLTKARTGYDADRDSYYTNTDLTGKNTSRLPAFHQLDVRVDRTWTYSVYKLGLYLEIFNVYNRKNTEAITYDYRYRTTSGLHILPFFPNIGIKGEW